MTRALLITAVWLSGFIYAGRPLLVGAAAAGVAPSVAWSGLIFVSFLPMLPLAMRRREIPVHRGFAHWTGYVTLAFFSTLFVLVILGDLVRLAYDGVRWILPTYHWPLLDGRVMSLVILGATVAFSLIGVLQARLPRTRRVKIAIENLPPELEGYRIVQWSDVHVGPTIRGKFVQTLVDRTNALDADAVAITGDLVDGPIEDLLQHVEPVRELRARDGVFFITGNHEYYWRAPEWIRALESFGLVFLKNEHRVVSRGLVIAGVTDPAGRYTHKPDPAGALAGAPPDAIKVLLSHRPETARAADRLGVHLQLSGHTHGGQMFPWNLMLRRFHFVQAGLRRIGRTWLYVNRGTGYWGPPSRLAVGGELTVIELTK